jgi:hypothetical protein
MSQSSCCRAGRLAEQQVERNFAHIIEDNYDVALGEA